MHKENLIHAHGSGFQAMIFRWLWKNNLVDISETMFSNLILWCSYCALFNLYCKVFYKFCGNELMKLQWIKWLIRPSVSEGCGVLHPSFWAHRSSWADWDLYLLLSEKGRISVKTRGTKSGKVEFSSNCKTLNLYKAPWGEWMQHIWELLLAFLHFVECSIW